MSLVGWTQVPRLSPYPALPVRRYDSSIRAIRSPDIAELLKAMNDERENTMMSVSSPPEHDPRMRSGAADQYSTSDRTDSTLFPDSTGQSLASASVPANPGTTSASVPANPAATSADEPANRSFVVTWILSLFLGVFGADRFYTGRWVTGLLKFLTVGGLGLWWAIDLVVIMAGGQRYDKRRLAGYDSCKEIAWIATGFLIIVAYSLQLDEVIAALIGRIF